MYPLRHPRITPHNKTEGVFAVCKVAKGQFVTGGGKGRLVHTWTEEHL